MSQVVRYSNAGGEGRLVGSLVKPRIRPGLAVVDDVLFAAGGYSQRTVYHMSEENIDKINEEVERDVESSVEYYIPEHDTWVMMKTQPRFNYGRVAIGVVDKPIRLLKDLSFEV